MSVNLGVGANMFDVANPIMNHPHPAPHRCTNNHHQWVVETIPECYVYCCVSHMISMFAATRCSISDYVMCPL